MMINWEKCLNGKCGSFRGRCHGDKVLVRRDGRTNKRRKGSKTMACDSHSTQRYKNKLKADKAFELFCYQQIKEANFSQSLMPS